MIEKIKELDEHHILYRDSKNGIAWVCDTSSGMCYSAHPNIMQSGSVRGMKALGYWDKSDKVVESHGYKHNISKLVISDTWDKVVAAHCQCSECKKQHENENSKERLG